MGAADQPTGRDDSPLDQVFDDTAARGEGTEWAYAQLREGRSPEAVTDDMVAKGWSRDDGEELVETARRAYRDRRGPPATAGASADPAASEHWRAWARLALEHGRTPQAVTDELVADGWSRDDARRLVAGVADSAAPREPGPDEAAALSRAYRRARGGHIRRMVIGALVVVGGAAATFFSYRAATGAGGGPT